MMIAATCSLADGKIAVSHLWDEMLVSGEEKSDMFQWLFIFG
jgi:hypothetical protein